MKKCISVLCVVILVLLCSACEQTFTVEMSGTDPDDTVSVEIILPDGGKEQDVTFIIDGAVCKSILYEMYRQNRTEFKQMIGGAK